MRHSSIRPKYKSDDHDLLFRFYPSSMHFKQQLRCFTLLYTGRGVTNSNCAALHCCIRGVTNSNCAALHCCTYIYGALQTVVYPYLLVIDSEHWKYASRPKPDCKYCYQRKLEITRNTDLYLSYSIKYPFPLLS